MSTLTIPTLNQLRADIRARVAGLRALRRLLRLAEAAEAARAASQPTTARPHDTQAHRGAEVCHDG